MLADLTPPLPLLLLEVVVNKSGEAHWGAAVAPAIPYIRNIITSFADMFPLLLFYLLFPSIYYPEMLYFRFVYSCI
jgi:hypothetical protein